MKRFCTLSVLSIGLAFIATSVISAPLNLSSSEVDENILHTTVVTTNSKEPINLDVQPCLGSWTGSACETRVCVEPTAASFSVRNPQNFSLIGDIVSRLLKFYDEPSLNCINEIATVLVKNQSSITTGYKLTYKTGEYYYLKASPSSATLYYDADSDTWSDKSSL